MERIRYSQYLGANVILLAPRNGENVEAPGYHRVLFSFYEN